MRQLAPYGPGTTGRGDDFADLSGDEYAGRIYPWEDSANPAGTELATRHLEKLALPPEKLAALWNHKSQKTGKHAWREAFLECLDLLFAQPKV